MLDGCSFRWSDQGSAIEETEGVNCEDIGGKAFWQRRQHTQGPRDERSPGECEDQHRAHVAGAGCLQG